MPKAGKGSALCFLNTGKGFTIIFSAEENKPWCGMSISGERRPPFVCRGDREVAQGRGLLFQLSAVSLVLPKLLNPHILPQGIF